jgi:hypothetical protein
MFTILLVLDLIILFGIGAAVEHEQPFISALATVVFAGILFWLFQIDPVKAISTYYGHVILGFVGWFLAGAVTAFVKWGFYIRRPEHEETVKQAYDTWTQVVERDGLEAWGPFEKYSRNPFKLDKNIGRIMHWIVFWPATILWALTYRLVERVATGIYNSIKGALVSMANARINKIVSK